MGSSGFYIYIYNIGTWGGTIHMYIYNMNTYTHTHIYIYIYALEPIMLAPGPRGKVRVPNHNLGTSELHPPKPVPVTLGFRVWGLGFRV